MALKDWIEWFNSNFGDKVRAGAAGTPFPDYFFTALAMKETGYVWGRLARKGELSTAQILELCVGDIIGAPKRGPFPRTKQELEDYPNGVRMFEIARKSLEDLNVQIADYRPYTTPVKFCRGFGIFQYDLQHFKKNPQYFLERKWFDFDACLAQCLNELKESLLTVYGDRETLTDKQLVYVAIAYNTGSADLSKGFNQGHNGTYGTDFNNYMIAAKAHNNGGPAGLPLLKKGSRGSFVKLWQQFLTDQGFDPKGVDGKYEGDSERATIAFQEKYDLGVDGQVGDDTWGQAIRLGLVVAPGQ